MRARAAIVYCHKTARRVYVQRLFGRRGILCVRTFPVLYAHSLGECLARGASPICVDCGMMSFDTIMVRASFVVDVVTRRAVRCVFMSAAVVMCARTAH